MRPAIYSLPVGKISKKLLARLFGVRRLGPGQQAHTARSAHGSRDVSVREPHAPCREPVDVRRGNVFAPVTAQIAIAQVVDEDEDDVGLNGVGSE